MPEVIAYEITCPPLADGEALATVYVPPVGRGDTVVSRRVELSPHTLRNLAGWAAKLEITS